MINIQNSKIRCVLLYVKKGLPTESMNPSMKYNPGLFVIKILLKNEKREQLRQQTFQGVHLNSSSIDIYVPFCI